MEGNMKFQKIHELKTIVKTVEKDNYKESFNAGLEVLRQTKALGGSKTTVYAEVVAWRSELEEELLKESLVGDWLDCICGWVGNPEWDIWLEE